MFDVRRSSSAFPFKRSSFAVLRISSFSNNELENHNRNPERGTSNAEPRTPNLEP